MADHLPADPGGLKDDHGLQEEWIGDAQLGHQGGQVGRPGELVEGRVKVVQGVAHLVQSPVHWSDQVSVGVKGPVLEERTDHVS